MSIQDASEKNVGLVFDASIPRARTPKGGLPTPSNYDALVSQYQKWVYVCASKNATAVASTPLRLYATRATGQAGSRRAARKISHDETEHIKSLKYLAESPMVKAAEDFEEILEHPLLRLLKEANPFHSFYDILESTDTFMELTGDGYWYVVKDDMGLPANIWVLPSQSVRIVPDKTDYIKGYLFGRDTTRQVAFKPEDVVHFKFTNPNNPYYGRGPLEASLGAVGRYNEMDAYEGALFRNRGQVGTLIQFDGDLTREQRVQTEQEFNNALRGITNAGKVKVVDKNFTVTELGVGPKDLSYLQGRKWTRTEIAAAFGVPLGLLDVEDVNKANAAEALHQYYKFTITPRLVKIAEKINSDIIPMFGEPRLFVAFDDVVPDDQDMAMRQEDQDVKNLVRSINEVRGARGLEPVEWGNVPIAPITVAPLGSAPPVAAPAEARAMKHIEACSCGQCGTEEKRVGDEGFQIISAPDGASGGANPRLSPSEQGIVNSIEDVWERQKKKAVSAAKLKGTDFDQFADIEWIDDMVEGSTPFMRGSLVRGGREALREIAAELDKPLATALEQFSSSTQIDKFVSESAFKFSKDVAADVVADLKLKFTAQVSNGDSLAQIKKGIEGVFEGQVSSKRAWMIARTETKRAQMVGKVMAWGEEGFTKKEWIASDDACPFCLSMDQKQAGMSENYFDEGKELPITSEAFGTDEDGKLKTRSLKFNYADVIAPPLHPGCRCTIVPVFE